MKVIKVHCMLAWTCHDEGLYYVWLIYVNKEKKNTKPMINNLRTLKSFSCHWSRQSTPWHVWEGTLNATHPFWPELQVFWPVSQNLIWRLTPRWESYKYKETKYNTWNTNTLNSPINVSLLINSAEGPWILSTRSDRAVLDLSCGANSKYDPVYASSWRMQ